MKPKPITKSHIKMTWIKASDISVVYTEAQRDLVNVWAARIAADWDPNKLTALTVAKLNGDTRYHCVDGQHRLAALDLLNLNDMQLPCIVKKVESVAEMAEIFWGANNSRHPSAIDLFKTRVLWDDTAAEINDVIESAGWTVVNNESVHSAFFAVQAAERIAIRHGLEHLRLTLETIASTFGVTTAATHNGILAGFSLVLLDDNCDTVRLADRASAELIPASLRAKGLSLREGLGGSIGTNIARVLAGVYNTRLRSTNHLIIK